MKPLYLVALLGLAGPALAQETPTNYPACSSTVQDRCNEAVKPATASHAAHKARHHAAHMTAKKPSDSPAPSSN
mgnify:CR=1 FL=1